MLGAGRRGWTLKVKEITFPEESAKEQKLTANLTPALWKKHEPARQKLIPLAANGVRAETLPRDARIPFSSQEEGGDSDKGCYAQRCQPANNTVSTLSPLHQLHPPGTKSHETASTAYEQ